MQDRVPSGFLCYNFLKLVECHISFETSECCNCLFSFIIYIISCSLVDHISSFVLFSLFFKTIKRSQSLSSRCTWRMIISLPWPWVPSVGQMGKEVVFFQRNLFYSVLILIFSFHVHGTRKHFENWNCSKFIGDIVMLVSSSMAMRDRSSESARFEVLHSQHRYVSF